MDGVVYIIHLPDNKFYIGATNNLEKRLKQHINGKNYLSKLIRECKFDLNQLTDRTDIHYQGEHYKLREQDFIFANKIDPDMLNRRVSDPSKEKKSNIDHTGKATTHIEIWESTRDELKRIAKDEGVSMKKMLDILAKANMGKLLKDLNK